ncbi:anthranilate synthase component I family protein [Tunicatimonas pelagia]|uniref:anthranilate synthase component I family protein n=1 Tax=Tunicatimonas pelagia TaxID=931531 RepID=UPI0026655B26|nr:anthranilate synthase component I family protein [Tunicatimonas pelagia]WKN41191.1 anthranilate synthase component I family protein [Tunicatimonas pelagia]
MNTQSPPNTFRLVTRSERLLADTVTPVSIYLKIRDRYENPILLESSDYHSSDNSFSFICCQPIASFSVNQRTVTQVFPDGTKDSQSVENPQAVVEMLAQFSQRFESEESNYRFTTSGLFGYMAYDAVQYFEEIDLSSDEKTHYNVPEIYYAVYRYVVVVDHFRNELYAFEHQYEGNDGEDSGLTNLLALINNKNIPSYHFKRSEAEGSNYTDDEFLEIIRKGQEHCFRGDVFQIVLSRRFQTAFKGDEFNVYRTLRSINPSPYLFYFDYGNYKLFGSSPEAQIVIKGDTASIYPIAGTFRRTGSDEADAELARKLMDDPKENSEHVMLVDLARNDLSRNGDDVTVETFKEIQYFSHVIHLVSKVTGTLSKETSPIRVVADTFPAGTLSGAPKHMAMQLIHRYETTQRGYYGGALGFLGFNGDFNHAIMIRSFLSQDNTLYYQAGAGVVAKSEAKKELQEVNNKLAALRKALELAETIAN